MSTAGAARPGARATPSAVPEVSVVIPTFNRADRLCEAVDSVLGQTFRTLECVIVDDGSTDGTPEVIEARYGADGRVRHVVQENAGPAAARNRGVTLARGAFIAFLDSDDLWDPEKLAIQMDLMRRERQAALCFCDRRIAGEPESSRFVATGFSGDLSMAGLLRDNLPICTPSVVVRKEALTQAGGFDPSFTCAEDWDLWIRIRARHPFTYVDRPLVTVRPGEDSFGRARPLEKWRSWLQLWTRHESLLLDHGCPGSLVRGKKAHAHKKVAQTLHRMGRYAEARHHYLQWWRCGRWRVRAIFWWAVLLLPWKRDGRTAPAG